MPEPVRDHHRERRSAGAEIVDEDTFHVLVDLEVRKARRLRYVVSMVCFEFGEAPFAGADPAEAMGRLAPAVRSTDAMLSQTPSTVALLLVDADAASLPAIVDRVTSMVSGVPWSAGGACYPETAGSASELVEQANATMLRAKRDGHQSFYVGK